jgi:FKBP-type peptidyl-prolyl cis-trans isomerase
VTTKERPDGSVEHDYDFAGETYVGVPPIKTPSGLLYYDLKKGDGPQPAGPNSTVRVHYTGWLRDGKKFDSSYDRVEPFETKLSNVIAGWTEGVGSMKAGGKRKLVIPYKLGYGETGQPPNIPPKTTLIFDIELISVVN